jgi:hypothetical protein
MLVPVVAIVDGVKIEFYPDEHPRRISMRAMPSLWLRLKSEPMRFCVVRCLPRNPVVCYCGPADIN